MTALEFHTRIENDADIAIPAELAARIPKGKPVRVLITFDDSTDEAAEDKAWRRLTQESFFNGYAESDSIYDEYDKLHGG